MRVALHFVGHLRTFRETSPKLMENVINPNVLRGCDISVFMHTWDVWNTTNYGTSRYRFYCNLDLNEKKIDDEDVKWLSQNLWFKSN